MDEQSAVSFDEGLQGFFQSSALNAPVWTLVRIAEIAADMYDRAEHPGDFGDQGTMQILSDWFPKLRDALDDASLLRP